MRKPPGIPQHLWDDPLFRAKYAEAHGHHFTNSADFKQGTTKGGPTRPDDRAVGPRSTGLPNEHQRAASLHGLSTRQVQRILRAKGYDIGLDGVMGPQTKEAIDAYVKGKSPNQFNAYLHRKYAPAPTPAAKGAGAAGGASGSAGASTKGGGSSGGGGGLLGLVNSLLGQAGSVGTMIPGDTADDIAGLQYDQDIADMQHELDLQPAREAQNLHDIAGYYGKVLDAQAQAAQADKEAGAAGTKSVGDAVAAIVSSLGGSANAGSAQTAAEGADATGTLAALANAQDFYNQSLRPLLQQETAEQQTAEKARSSSRRDELISKLAGLKNARGQAQSAAMLDIIGKNNELAQTRFGNRASLVNTLGALQTAASQAESRKLDNAIKLAKLNKPANISPTALHSVAGQAFTQFLDNTGKIDKTVTQRLGVNGIVRAIKNAYLGAGLDLGNPQVAQSAFSVARQLSLNGVGFTPDPRWFGLG